MTALRVLAFVLTSPLWVPFFLMCSVFFCFYLSVACLVSVLSFAFNGEWVSPLDWGN